MNPLEIPPDCPFKRVCGLIETALREDPDALIDPKLNDEIAGVLVEGAAHVDKCMEENKGCIFNLTSHNYPYPEDLTREQRWSIWHALVFQWCAKGLASQELHRLNRSRFLH